MSLNKTDNQKHDLEQSRREEKQKLRQVIVDILSDYIIENELNISSHE
jgi:hypothetical protein